MKIAFRRPSDNTVYAVVGSKHMRELKRSKQLYKYLKKHRDSGVVIDAPKG